jgi:hypothetical protein
MPNHSTTLLIGERRLQGDLCAVPGTRGLVVLGLSWMGREASLALGSARLAHRTNTGGDRRQRSRTASHRQAAARQEVDLHVDDDQGIAESRP